MNLVEKIKSGSREIIRTANPRASFTANLGMTIGLLRQEAGTVLPLVGDFAVNWTKAGSEMMPHVMSMSTQINLQIFGLQTRIFLTEMAIKVLENHQIIDPVAAFLTILGFVRLFVQSNKSNTSR